MPEVSDNAAIFIATSFQAHERAKMGEDLTMICNCTISIIFAAFYIEETLSVIIEKLNKTDTMIDFVKKGNYPGLFPKLAWFYNFYVTTSHPLTHDQLFMKNKQKEFLLLKDLENKFPGFTRIYRFRNDVAHGKITQSITPEEEDNLRQNAKNIAAELLIIATDSGCQIPRTTTYWDAIDNLKKTNPSI